MSRDELPSLEPEIESLLRSERAADVSPAALERVWTRVAVSVLRSGPGDGGERVAEAARTPAGWLRSHARAAVLAAFVGGAAFGGALAMAMRPAETERIVYVEKPVAVPVVAGPPSAPAVQPTEPVVSPSPNVEPKPALPSRRPPAPSESTNLEAERLLLDSARTALSQGDTASALASISDHARRFPHAQLAEEREALAVQALVGGGRYDEARARASRFGAAWPSSLFLPAVEASLASIPRSVDERTAPSP